MHVEPKVQRNRCKDCNLGLQSRAEGCEGNHVRRKNENHFGLRLKEVQEEYGVMMGWSTKSGSKGQSCLDLA